MGQEAKEDSIAGNDGYICSLCRDRLSPAIAEAARRYRCLQRTLQRHPTMQRRMLLRAYKWSKPRILRFRSAIGMTGT